MHIALVHNERAGAKQHSASDLVQIFRGLGHETEVYGRDSDGLLRVLNSRADVVVVSGGDGTVSRVAIALCGADTPMFVLPAGTSNNVATSVGAGSGTIRTLAGRLPSARLTRLDVWRIAGDGHETCFVESAGSGVIGTMFDEHDRRTRRWLRRLRWRLSRKVDHWESTARHVAQLLRREKPRWMDVRADGDDLSGEYITVEAMNVRAIGPRVVLAPNADAGDGMLDLVLVSSDDRDELADHIESRGASTSIPSALGRRARRVELDWPEKATHVDDERWPSEKASRRPRRVAIEIRGGVNLLIPE